MLIASLYDFVGQDLQAAEFWAAYKYVEHSGIPAASSGEARHLDDLLEEAITFLRSATLFPCKRSSGTEGRIRQMKRSSSRKLLLSLPEDLFGALDRAAKLLGISRLGLIRLCLIRSLGSLDQNVRPPSR